LKWYKNLNLISISILGGAYAALLGDHWCRVLVEITDFGIKQVFCVDSGRRSMIKPDMMIHELRDRFEIQLTFIKRSVYFIYSI